MTSLQLSITSLQHSWLCEACFKVSSHQYDIATKLVFLYCKGKKVGHPCMVWYILMNNLGFSHLGRNTQGGKGTISPGNWSTLKTSYAKLHFFAFQLLLLDMAEAWAYWRTFKKRFNSTSICFENQFYIENELHKIIKEILHRRILPKSLILESNGV